MPKHTPRKRFGQHFLTDKNVLKRMTDTILANHSEQIIEIGPGKGALTQYLIESPKRLDAIEIDDDLATLLKERWGTRANFHLHQQDVMKIEFTRLIETNHSTCITGNLPYNLSTPILFELTKHLENIDVMYFLLQKEVVDRITATPGSKSYGRLGVMLQYHCTAQSLFDVPSSAFSPPPRVNSTYLMLRPKREKDALQNPKQFATLVRDAFNQRRKMLSNSLKKHICPEALEAAGINPQQRPESLSVSDFVKISNAISGSEG